LLCGSAAGIFLSLALISILLDRYPIPTILFFTGLIIGTIPNIFKKIDNHANIIPKMVFYLIGSIFIIMLPFIPTVTSQVEVLNIDLSILFTLFFLGFIISLTVIIPGVSGSLILLVFGYYEYITNIIVSFIKSIIDMESIAIFRNFITLIVFGLGIFIGIVTFSKLINYLLKKYSSYVYTMIIGLLIASPIAIIYQMITTYRDLIYENILFNFLLGMLFLILGIILTNLISNNEKG
jgi:putative membrane protein